VSKLATPAQVGDCQAANVLRTRSAATNMAAQNQRSRNLRSLRTLRGSSLEQISNAGAAAGLNVIFQKGTHTFTYNDLAGIGNAQVLGPTRQLAPGVTPEQDLGSAVLATIDHLEKVSPSSAASPLVAPVTSSESSKMGVREDDGVPWVKFPPKPEGWKGDPGNPNFKALGTLSPPVMRKIEPAGPHFLAFARRVSPCNHFLRCMLTIFSETSWPHFLRG